MLGLVIYYQRKLGTIAGGGSARSCSFFSFFLSLLFFLFSFSFFSLFSLSLLAPLARTGADARRARARVNSRISVNKLVKQLTPPAIRDCCAGRLFSVFSPPLKHHMLFLRQISSQNYRWAHIAFRTMRTLDFFEYLRASCSLLPVVRSR